jgi:hypothetical protein
MKSKDIEFLDEQSEIIEGLSAPEIHKLLAGLPPIQVGDFISMVICDENKTVITSIDVDSLSYKLKTKISKTCKFDTKVIKKYMEDYDLTFIQAKTLLVLKTQYLCNEFAVTGVEIFREIFKKKLDEIFAKLEEDVVRATLQEWRTNNYLINDDTVDFNKMEGFWNDKRSFIQNPTGGRPTGVEAPEKPYDRVKEDTEVTYLTKLIEQAVQAALAKDPESNLTLQRIADEIAEVERPHLGSSKDKSGKNIGPKEYRVHPVDPQEKIIKMSVTKQIVGKWLEKIGFDVRYLENTFRLKMRNIKS